ncbi:MAG: energy transducer TonB [Hyphomonadaceae bacterium]|jgi:protein TonB|uniref:energy transducer TonB n=1 Tax=Aquidulcibacter sp. TaxID=2052990 RepID=UPI0022C9513A|nr:energy transducer TonB [Aquidulcibacter sp.]MCZ8210066.1 TonB family protein [Aquidulcibacter sp.]
MKQSHALAPPTQKLLYRAAALTGSGILWIGIGYLALTYVPTIQKLQMPEPPPIAVAPRDPPKPIIPPKPEPEKPVKNQQVQQTPDNTPTLTERPTTEVVPLGPVDSLPIRPVGEGPVAFTGGGETLGPAVGPMPTEIAPEAPPAPRLIINPIRQAGANPGFPRKALDREISGEVTLSFTVTAQGKVANLTVINEAPKGYGFAEAARKAVEAWTFQPQTIDGIAVAYPARYTISFKLED